MGSIAVASLVAQFAFPTLLIVGWLRGDVGIRLAALFVALASAASLALPRVTIGGSALVTSVLAALDIALVFVVFKGDVRIT